MSRTWSLKSVLLIFIWKCFSKRKKFWYSSVFWSADAQKFQISVLKFGSQIKRCFTYWILLAKTRLICFICAQREEKGDFDFLLKIWEKNVACILRELQKLKSVFWFENSVVTLGRSISGRLLSHKDLFVQCIYTLMKACIKTDLCENFGCYFVEFKKVYYLKRVYSLINLETSWPRLF